MKLIYIKLHYYFFLLILISFFSLFLSCTGKHVNKFVTDKEIIGNDILYQEDIDRADQEKQAMLYKTLLSEADKYSSEGDIKKVFAVYDRALTIVSFAQRLILIQKINELLSSVSVTLLEELYEIKKLTELEPFLIYELGFRYIIKKEFNKAKNIFSVFEQKYPLNEHYSKACDLLKLAKESMFNRDIIGCVLPLSGKYSGFGQQALSGIELALIDFQEKYNKKLVILIKDTGGDDKRAASCVQELCDKRVSSIIGPMVTAVSAGKVAEINETPMIAMTQKKLNLSKEEYLFSNFITPELETKALVSYAFSNLNVKRFAILYPKDKYGDTYMNLFWDMVDEVGGEIKAVESYDPEDTDFGGAIKKISGEYYLGEDDEKDNGDRGAEKTSTEDEDKENEEEQIDYEAIFIPDTSTNVAQILPQLAYHDITDIYLLGTKLWHQNNIIKNARGYNNNAVIMAGFFDKSKNENVIKFTKDFTDLFGTAPGFIEAIAYDTASILFDIIKNDNVSTREELRNQIISKRVFQGVTGATFFDENGDLHKELYYLTIQNRKFVEIKK